jgi:MraZ protein
MPLPPPADKPLLTNTTGIPPITIPTPPPVPTPPSVILPVGFTEVAPAKPKEALPDLPASPPLGPNNKPTPDATPGVTTQLNLPNAVINPPVVSPSPEVKPVHAEAKPSEPGEPPLAPPAGPVQMYQVRLAQETMRDIARKTLGDTERWTEIQKLNPSLKPEVAVLNGAFVRLPADACVPPEEVSEVKPLPLLRPDSGPAKPKVLLPLTGTYPCNLDDKRIIALPRAMRDQIGDGDTVLVSPGPDHCLWVTTQEHLERLAKRLEASPARENEVRSFRRLYFAQTEKVTLTAEGRIQIPDRLAQFAGLHQEVVLIGIDDHFELWDVARWRQYTQAKSAAARSAMSDD